MVIIKVKLKSKVNLKFEEKKHVKKPLGIKPDGYVFKDGQHYFYEYLGEF